MNMKMRNNSYWIQLGINRSRSKNIVQSWIFLWIVINSKWFWKIQPGINKKDNGMCQTLLIDKKWSIFQSCMAWVNKWSKNKNKRNK